MKEYRGKGYGKKLLETAIQFLNEKEVEEICLTVIEKIVLPMKCIRREDLRFIIN